MSSIPIVNTSFAHLFIRFLLQNGCPVRRWLANASLPISLLDNVDGYVSEYHLRKFIEDAAKKTGLSELGLLVAETSSMTELGELAVKMKDTENLYESLTMFCHNVADENSHATFWLSQHEEETWFCRANPDELEIGQQYAEQFTVVYMIKLVQLVAEVDWYPEQVWLKTSENSHYKKHPYFQHCKISFNRGLSAIMLPEIKGAEVDIHQQFNTPEINPPNLTSTLTELLKLYLSDTYPDIELAAELSRLKVRTLKRRLSEENITYRELVQQVRLEVACSLLEEPDRQIIEVASALSYANPGNFSRAFHRWMGMTPHEYQRMHHNKT